MQANIGDIITWQTEGPDTEVRQGIVDDLLYFPEVTGLGDKVCDYVVLTDDPWRNVCIVSIGQVTSVFQKAKQDEQA